MTKNKYVTQEEFDKKMEDIDGKFSKLDGCHEKIDKKVDKLTTNQTLNHNRLKRIENGIWAILIAVLGAVVTNIVASK